MAFPTQSTTMRVVIREVNMIQNHVSGDDAFGKTYQMMVDFHGPVVIVPQVGELWLARRRGNDWVLDARLEKGNEQTNLGSLGQGDRRLEANTVLYLNGTHVLINGVDFQNILDRLAALEAAASP